jgi:peptidoglycan hydrolase FlgJ
VAGTSSDVVLGVALAADPQKQRAAAERLRSLSAAAPAQVDASAWHASVAQHIEAGQAGAAGSPTQGATSMGRRPARTAPDAFGQLEAVVMQTFIQSMLPKNAKHVFGKGLAGDVWRSMLAEKLANELARSGQVGLASRLQAGSAAGRLAGTGFGVAAVAAPALSQPLAPADGSISPEGARS